jgi:hypothetical protein
MGKLVYPVLLAFVFGSSGAAAQVVHKCVGEGGEIVYQSLECGPGQDRRRTWVTAPAEVSPADLRRRQQRERAGSEYLRKLATRGGGRRSGGGAAISRYQEPKRCARARARRAEAQSGSRRLSLEQLERLGDMVYEACK